MRWKKPTTPSHGDRCLRLFFAWRPVTIGDETRWFEEVVVEYVWREPSVTVSQVDCFTTEGRWEAVRFADDRFCRGRNGSQIIPDRPPAPPPPPPVPTPQELSNYARAVAKYHSGNT